MKKLALIGLLFLLPFYGVWGTDKQEASYTSFDKKELKNLIKKSGIGLRLGEKFYYSFSFTYGGFMKTADKEDVRQDRSYKVKRTIKSINKCMMGEAIHKEWPFNQKECCAYAYQTIEEIKKGFWILPETRFEKLYKVAKELKNKLNESMQDIAALGIVLQASDLILAGHDLKDINSLENNIRKCFNNTVYSDSCRSAKKALRTFRNQDRKNSALYKKSLTKIKEFKKTVLKESKIKEQK